MKRSFLTSFISLMICSAGFTQPLTGNKYIPGNYPTVAAAIVALNTQGVGTGGVTFSLTAGYTETFASPTSGLITTTTGSSTRPILFQKSGTGANPVISSNGSGAITDYIFCIAGTDYITFDRIDVYEPVGVTEWGYAVLKGSASNGSQHVTIKNCTITLERSNIFTIGIYSNNVTPTSPATQLTIVDAAGANSNNKYFGNTILNCYNAIKIVGYRDPAYPYDYYDQKCEIGVEGANTITDFGGDVPDCYGIYTKNQSGQKIANNTINGYSAGSGVCAGIKIDTVNNTNLDIYNNTVSIYYSGTGDFYGIYDVHANNYVNATTMNIYNNTVSNCVYESPEYGNCTFIHVRAGAASNNFFNNIVTNNTYGTGSSAAQGTLYGIFYHGSLNMPGSVSYHHNQVTNITRVQISPGSGETNYMRVFGGGNQADVYSNRVDNNVVASSGLCIGMYCLMDPRGLKNIYDNIVTNILDANGDVTGISSGNSDGTSIFRNKVQNINSNGSSARVIGIELGSLLKGDMYCYNNMVGDLKNPASSNQTAIIGIWANPYGTNLMGFYNNTIYLNATSSGADFGTVGLYLGIYTKENEVINNIIINKSIATGSGITAVIRYMMDIDFYNYSGISDNNNFYAGTPGSSQVILYDGIHSFQTIADFKARVYPADGQTISEMPSFVNGVDSPMDLHIDPAQLTGVESAGKIITTIDVSTDFDHEQRFPNPGYPMNITSPPIAPDLGADEFGGIPNDMTPPAINCVPLMNTASLTARTLIATIHDMRGVPSSGPGLPRLAWKKSAIGTWSFATGSSLGNDQYSFSFGGGVSLNDTVFYFILAQDNWSTPNTGTYPMPGSAGFSANPPAVITPPAPLLSYKIVQGLCGTIMVGTGQIYPTLSAAINDVSNRELTCPVTLLLTDNIYPGETYPIIINQIPGASHVNTLTIKPAPGKTPLFSTSYQGADPDYWSMITLNGTQHIIFDGSNGNGNDRSLTFRNEYLYGYVAALGFYNNGNTPASYITVKNCVVQASSQSVMNSQAITTMGIIGYGGYHDILISNNEITSAKTGIVIMGTPSNPAYNIQVSNNVLGSLDYIKNINQWCVTLEFCDSILVEGNELMGSIEGRAPIGSYTGIYIGRNATNTRIRKNLIHDFYHLTDGADAIMYNGVNEGMTEISNNVIYNIKSPGFTQDLSASNAYGIYINKGGYLKLFFNSIDLGGNYLVAGNSGMSSCIGIWNGVTNVELKNNIFKNSSMPVSGTSGPKSYAIGIGTGTSNIIMDYNDYFVDGAGPNIGYLAGTDLQTLADWKTATGQDENTTSIDPVFTSPIFLKPTTLLMSHSGTYLSDLPTDIAGINRTNPPDVGAYEFSMNPQIVTTAASMISATGANLNGTINAAFHTVASWFDYGQTQAYGSTVAGIPATVMGNITTPVGATLTDLPPLTTLHFRCRGVASDGLIIYGNDQTFTTGAGIPENTTATGSVSNDTCINAIHVITVGGTTNPFVVTATGHATLVAGEKIICLPGTMVMQGGYFHGYITTDGQYCMAPANPVVSNQKEGEVQSIVIEGHKNKHFNIYPNPVGNSFTLEWTGDGESGMLGADLFSMNGVKVLSEDLFSEHTHVFSVEGLRPGVYIIQVKTGKSRETLKLIKL
jgi:trimeric autotransporter adhesin